MILVFFRLDSIDIHTLEHKLQVFGKLIHQLLVVRLHVGCQVMVATLGLDLCKEFTGVNFVHFAVSRGGPQ